MIGIFDSGVGGLSVLREMRRILPEYDLTYYGDTARGPYGQRSLETVATFVSEGLSRLMDMGVGLLVVAGHDAAACLTDDIRSRLSVPVLDIVITGVIPSLKSLTSKAIGIIGPPLLEAAGIHKQAIRREFPGIPVFSVSAPLLEPLVEAGWLKKPETVMVVKKYLHYLKLRQVDTLVPGSNHFTSLTLVIQRKMGKRVTIVDALPPLAQGVKDFLTAHPEVEETCSKGGEFRIMVSDLTPNLTKTAKMFYGQNVKIERI